MQSRGPPPSVAVSFTAETGSRAAAENTNALNAGAKARYPFYAPLADFFMATNSTWGPMDLVDPVGRRVRPIKGDVNDPAAYPGSYRVDDMFFRLSFTGDSRRGPPVPASLRTEQGIPLFRIDEYFKMQDAGDYQLTLWPTIYQRESAGTDLCHKVTFPAARLTLHIGDSPIGVGPAKVPR